MHPIFNHHYRHQQHEKLIKKNAVDTFLYDEINDRLHMRLKDVNRHFKKAIIHSPPFFHPTLPIMANAPPLAHQQMPQQQSDDEIWPYEQNNFDLIYSVATLQWINDLPGLLTQFHRSLQPDGLLHAALLGGDSLWELRHCLIESETEILGGCRNHIHPMIDIKTAGDLMMRARYTLPVVDVEKITLTYDNIFALMQDLRASGLVNCLYNIHKGFSRRDVFVRANDIYIKKFSAPDNRLTANLDIIFIHGWHPAPSQPKALKPGTGEVSLKDFLT